LLFVPSGTGGLSGLPGRISDFKNNFTNLILCHTYLLSFKFVNLLPHFDIQYFDIQQFIIFFKVMLKNLIPGIFAGLLLAACGTSQNTAQKSFGTAVTADQAITYDELLPKMTAVDSMPAKVTGKVHEVCQKKGCWITIVSDQPGTPEMRVTFKDYAFFMPKDLSGKKVVIDGYAIVETTPVDVLRHYAEDAKKSQAEIDAITEPKRELAFEAAGVLILD